MEVTYIHYLDAIIDIAKQAGQAILKLHKKDENLKFELKTDNSPLTDADLIANDIITTQLSILTPNIPILSEESPIPYEQRIIWHKYWLVDPLDGTNEFIKHSGQFTVNIALIEDHQPILGVSYAPVFKKCYYACKNHGAFCKDETGKITQLHTRMINNSEIKIVISKELGINSLKLLLTKLPKYKVSYFGSSLKLCLVAEGAADLYPRYGSNCEWDTAAGQCIVEEAGGIAVDLDFNPLRYNTKESFRNPYFLVMGDQKVKTFL